MNPFQVYMHEHVYLDDFITVGPPASHKCQEALDRVCGCLACLALLSTLWPDKLQWLRDGG